MSRSSIGSVAQARRTTRLGLLATAMITWWVLSLPSVVEACSVCTAGRDEENAAAFLLTTIFMSILPLAALGTLIFVIWRRIQKLENEADSRSEIPNPAPLAIPVRPETRS